MYVCTWCMYTHIHSYIYTYARVCVRTYVENLGSWIHKLISSWITRSLPVSQLLLSPHFSLESFYWYIVETLPWRGGMFPFCSWILQTHKSIWLQPPPSPNLGLISPWRIGGGGGWGVLSLVSLSQIIQCLFNIQNCSPNLSPANPGDNFPDSGTGSLH